MRSIETWAALAEAQREARREWWSWTATIGIGGSSEYLRHMVSHHQERDNRIGRIMERIVISWHRLPLSN